MEKVSYVDLYFLKLGWEICSMFLVSKYQVRRSLTILSSSLHKTLVRKIGRKLVGRKESLFSFLIKIIIAIFQSSRKKSDFLILLNSFSLFRDARK